MIKKFDPRKFDGKRKYRAVLGAPRITQTFIWNEQKQEYYSPELSYMARRYEPHPDGKFKRKERFFGSLKAARAWQTGKVEVKPKLRVGTDNTIGRLLYDWRKTAWGHLRESTTIYYTKAITMYEFLYNIEVEKITPADIDGWLNHLKKDPSKFSSVRKDFKRELEIFGTVLRWYIDSNDNAKLILPFKKRHKKMAFLREGITRDKKFMLPEESERWLQALKIVAPEMYAAGFIQLNQVLRISELAAMKWTNLNVAHRTYRMCEHVIWPRVHGASPQILLGTKTMKAGQHFDIPLRDEVIELLQTLSRHPESDLIFHDSGRVLTYRQFQHAYDKAFKHTGLPYRGTHVLRHTGATQFLDETGDVLALKQMGNWAELKVALGYGQIMASRARKALDQARDRKLSLVRSEPDDSIEEVM